MARSKADIDIIIRIRDFADAELKKVGKTVEATGRKVEKTATQFKAASGKITQFGAAATASFAGVTSASLAFNTALLNVIKSTGAVGVGIAFISTAMIFAARATAKYEDDLGKLAIRLSVNVKDLSALQVAAERGGTEMDVMARAVRNLVLNMDKARLGSGQAQSAFEAIGFDIGQIGDKTREAIPSMIEIGRLLKDFRGDRTAKAGQIFGQLAGPEILPVLLSEGFAKAVDDTERFGLVVTEESAKAAALFRDTITNIKDLLFSFVVDVGDVVIPGLQPLLKQLEDILADVRAIKKEGLGSVDETKFQKFFARVQEGFKGLNPFGAVLSLTGNTDALTKVLREAFLGIETQASKVVEEDIPVRALRARSTTALRANITKVSVERASLGINKDLKNVFKEIISLNTNQNIVKQRGLEIALKSANAEDRLRLQTQAGQETVLANEERRVALKKIAIELSKVLIAQGLKPEVELVEKIQILQEKAGKRRNILDDLPESLTDTDPELISLDLQIERARELLQIQEERKEVVARIAELGGKLALAATKTKILDGKTVPDKEAFFDIKTQIGLLKDELRSLDTKAFDRLIEAGDTVATTIKVVGQIFDKLKFGKENAFREVDQLAIRPLLESLLALEEQINISKKALGEATSQAEALLRIAARIKSSAAEAKKFREQSFDVLGFKTKKDVEAFDPLKDVFTRITDITEIQAQIVGNTASNMRRSFDDLFFNVVTGRFKDLTSVVKQFGNAAVRSITDAAARAATAAIFRQVFAGRPGVSQGNFP